MLDVDRWPVEQPVRVAQEAAQKDWQLAVSSPRFEVWLQLHFVDVPEVERPRQRLAQLRAAHAPGGAMPWTRERIAAAIERARPLDVEPGDRWPQTPPATRAYRLAEQLLA